MILNKYLTLVLIFVFVIDGVAQYSVSGTITSSSSKKLLNNVKIFDGLGEELTSSNFKGLYSFSTDKSNIDLIFYADNFQFIEKRVILKKGTNILNVKMNAFSEELSEVEVKAHRRKVFELRRLKDVEQTAIYAGKKTEVVLLDQATVNLASNNARQIYSQVVGLNIFENDDAGLQLNIGGRGLDPNRTSNFNTRQNGYDISADVLGYPESYYSPPAEAIKEIQIIRGAASLQYGTQFGGLVNFVLKKPNPNKPLEIITRNTVGSNHLFTNFTSVSGTSKKLSYFTYYNYKMGDGFRPNSQFESKNAFFHLGYEFNSQTKLDAELTSLYYLAQQAGGLTDDMFYKDPYQSNRERNWFEIDWLLYNLKLSHSFSENTNFTFNFFGLHASRKAVGFRTNRVSEVDSNGFRDLIAGDFNNFGFEARLLNKYQFLGKKATFLIGSKFYKANNFSIQGPGTDGNDANFSSVLNQDPNYRNQSNFYNPNLNIALFGETIFYVTDKLSITPGFRVEYIDTGKEGYRKKITLDLADNVISNNSIEENLDTLIRSFVLFGMGVSYKPSTKFELYGNISENYRSFTFSDFNIVNPAFQVAEDLTDEKGFTADLGIRGDFNRYISYDLGVFTLFYNDRIGLIPVELDGGRVAMERRNIGDARILGVESLVDFNLKKVLNLSNDFDFNYFINSSFITSKMISSEKPGLVGNELEFVPKVNLKTGLRFGYKNFSSNIQYTYLSDQFTDASNAVKANLSGINGLIPSYDVLDFSSSYKYKYFKLEAGVNNVLNNSYFTRRATGYPGPGIIPSAPRTYYITLEFTI